MSFLFPLIFSGMVLIFIIVFFAFFPIRISWFYQSKIHMEKGHKVHVKSHKSQPAYSRYAYKEIENYDDDEL